MIAKDGAEAFTQEDYEQGLKYLEFVYNAQSEKVDRIQRIWLGPTLTED